MLDNACFLTPIACSVHSRQSTVRITNISRSISRRAVRSPQDAVVRLLGGALYVCFHIFTCVFLFFNQMDCWFVEWHWLNIDRRLVWHWLKLDWLLNTSSPRYFRKPESIGIYWYLRFYVLVNTRRPTRTTGRFTRSYTETQKNAQTAIRFGHSPFAHSKQYNYWSIHTLESESLYINVH